MSRLTQRSSPSFSATEFPQGTIEIGNDGKPWVVVEAKNGVPRWTPYTSVRLNGLRVLTLDYLEDHIGKPIKIYEREATHFWPKITRGGSFSDVYTFVPNGNAKLVSRKTPYKDWLITRNPAPPKRGGYLMITGERVSSGESDIDRYWGPIVQGDEVATGNPRNTQSFVKA